MAAVCPAGPEPIITSLECILLAPMPVPLRGEVAEARPGAACLWCKVAAAAIGKLREDRKGEKRVRRNAEANTLIDVLC